MTDSNLITEKVLDKKDMAAIINKIVILAIGSQFLNSRKKGVKSLLGSSFFSKFYGLSFGFLTSFFYLSLVGDISSSTDEGCVLVVLINLRF